MAQAAGLGKLTVYSGLGQPLRAELEVNANADELNGMTARLAPRDVFQQAGVDFSAALNDLRFAVEKSRGGASVVKLSSVRPINEPFLDFLVELNWSAGRLVREYTFLLDPPEFSGRQAAPAVADGKLVDAPVVPPKPYTMAPTPGTVVKMAPPPVNAAAPVRTQPTAEPKPVAEAKPVPQAKSKSLAEASPAKSTPAVATHTVEKGENLRKIAAEYQLDGVSLEQMLVGLYRDNPDAFIGKDIHRLKSGAILNLPNRERVEAVSPAEAKKVYLASGNFEAYRRKLASAAAQAPSSNEEDSAQTSAGRITPKVEDKSAAKDAARDQVKVARTDLADQAAKAAASEADRLAQLKALKEAETRVTQLEKNVEELQKLLALKNQALADLQKPAVTPQAPASAAVPTPPPTPAAVQPPPVAAEPAPEVKPAAAAAPVAESVAPATPAEPASPPPPPAPPAPPVKPLPPPPPPAEPVVEAPGVVDFLLEDPTLLAGGAGVLALVGGLLVYRRRRQQSSLTATTAIPSQASIGPNSVFGAMGGQSVDTGSIALPTGEFSQAGPGSIDTDEVDPVAEADVYMAYGRDAQAEEILLEALQKDPQRLAIHVKLLEIYGNRRSMKQFETLASELYAQTGGQGPEWAQVAKLGAALDPANPLYSGNEAPAGQRGYDADATMVVTPAAMAAMGQVRTDAAVLEDPDDQPPASATDTAVLDLSTVVIASPASTAPDHQVDEEAFNFDDASLDFDLGGGADDAAVAGNEALSIEVTPAEPVAAIDVDDNALDFDLDGLGGSDTPAPVMSQQPASNAIPAPADEMTMAGDEELDFAHSGTLVMPERLSDSAFEGFSVDTLEEPFEPPPSPPMPELEAAPSDVASGDDVSSTAEAAADEGLDFDVNLGDSLFLGESAPLPDFDMSAINLDLAADTAPAETAAQGEEAALAAAMAEPAPAEELTMDDWLAADADASAEPATVHSGSDLEPQPAVTPDTLAETAPSAEPAPAVHDAHWEEVNTKLDLARAYEEMGDLEGARELLQEVQAEGSEDLVAQAGEMMERIGR